ncbi:unnamed protein product [Phytophthora lilii]|uniref:Unnamed protein product n=1 Tax=Phytophthora lilii TaxID=2077276 RepID=A0A9W6TY48_9STRA|nr:unnamed protein product [Phytophthora lilii]
MNGDGEAFESEIRQHYELENAQNCGHWKKFHFHSSEARQQLATGIERDFRQFSRQIGVFTDERVMPNEHKDEERDNQQNDDTAIPASLPASNSPSKMTPIEDVLRLHLVQEWVHQERFNIEEAFTNQTKKHQEDLSAFLDQQNAEFLEERQKVLSASSESPLNVTKIAKQSRQKTSSHFQSNAKRGMLLQTAPPFRVESSKNEEEQGSRWRESTPGTRVLTSSRRVRSDVDETQEKLDVLARRLHIRKEVNSEIGSTCVALCCALKL